MDRIRGYSGPQFEERRHLVLQPFDRGRNCFECGQLGHIARDCFQRVSRGFGGRVGAFLGRDFSHGWVNPVPPGIHLVPGHGREPGYFVRDNGYKVWQPQVAVYNNRGHSHPGFRGGREQESQPSAPSHMRVGERDRGRGSVWVDGVSRLSDQSSGGEAKKPRSSSGGCETQQSENSKRVDAADAAAKTSSQSSDKGQEGWRDKEDQNPVGAGGSAALVELNREDSDSKQGGGGENSTVRNAASTALKKVVSKPIKGKSPLGLQDRETRECSNTGVGGSRGGQTRPVVSGGGGGKEEVQVSSENCEATTETVLSKDTSSLTATAPGRRASRWDTVRDDNNLDLWSDREQDNLGSSLQKLGGVQLSSKDNAGEKKPLMRDDSSPLAHRHMKDGKTKREELCQNLDDGFSDRVSRGATSRGNDANWGHDQDKGGGTWQLQKNVSSGLSNWGVERSDGMDREGDLASDYGSEDGKDRAGTDFRPGKDHSDHFGDRESAHWRFLENGSVHHPNRSVHGSRGGDNHFRREWENGGHKLHAHNPVGGLQQPNQSWDSDQKVESPYPDSHDARSHSQNNQGTTNSSSSQIPGELSIILMDASLISTSHPSSRGLNSSCLQPLEKEEQRESGPQRGGRLVSKDKEGSLCGWLQLTTELKDGMQLPSDCMEQLDGSTAWVTLEHAEESLLNSKMQVSSSPQGVTTCLHNQAQAEVCDLCSLHSTPKDVTVQDGSEGSDLHLETATHGRGLGHLQPVGGSNLKQPVEEDYYHIDERVKRLMQNFSLVLGREQDTVAEALLAASQRVTEDEFKFESEESPPSHAGSPTFGEQCKDGDHSHQPAGGSSIYQPSSSDVLHPTVHVEVSVESVPDTAPEAVEEPPVPLTPVGEVDLHRRNMHCWKYPTAGGDWIAIQSERHEASRASQSEKHVWRKRVLNSGVSLCDGQLSGQPDPRKQARKPEADGFERRKLELPNWACRKDEQAENPHDDHHMHYTPYKSTPKQRLPTPKSHLSTPVSFMPRGVAQTPKATKAAALGLISNGGKGSSGNSPGLATKSGRQHVGVERTKQKLGGSMNKEETVSVSINITNTVVRNEVLAVPEPYGKRETKVKVSGYHSGHTGSKKDSIKLASVSPHASHENEVPSGSCREEAGILTAVDQNRSSAFQGRSDLHLQEGLWHYLDAAGNEKGPFSVSDLKLMVADGRLLGGVSVFRKSDNVWVPVSSLYPCEHHGGDPVSSGDEPLTSHVHKEDSRYSPSEPLPPAVSPPTSDPSTNAVVGLPADGATTFCPRLPSLFHDEYPHFLGYTNGKLHERVMKSFRGIYGRFLNDALESWLSERQSGVPAAVLAPASSSMEIIGLRSPVTSVAANITSASTSLDTLSGREKPSEGISDTKGGGNVSERRPSDRHSKAQEKSVNDKVKRKDSSSVDRQMKSKGGSSLTTHWVEQRDENSTKSLAKQKGNSSLVYESALLVGSDDQQTSFQSADSSPLSHGNLVATPKDDSSPSKMKQKGWIIDDHQSRPAYVHRRSVARVCIPESDESDGDMASGEDLASCANLGTEVDARGVTVDDVPAIEEEFTKETDLGSRGEAEMDKSPQQSWAGLMSSLLMRIFCLLCGDPKSLAAAMSTCKSWKEYAKRIKESAECVDLSGLGPHCSDTMLKSLMGYGVGKLKYVILNSCTNVSSEALGHLLKACSSIRVVEINGCMQLREVVALHPQVEWVSKPLESKSASTRPSSVGRLSVDNKVKTLKIVGRKRQNSSRGLEDQSGYSLDESGSRDKSTGEEESTDADPMMIDSLDSTEKDMANRVEHSLTRELKRVKVGSVRKVVRTVLPNGCNNYKTQELTNGAEEGLHVKKKGDIDPVNCKMKALHNMTSNFKASSTHLSVTEKSTSPNCKVEFLGKGISLSPKVAEKELEKELTAALKAVMDADIDHVFVHAVNGQVPDSRNLLSRTGQMDFSTVQRRLRMGVYAGKDGVKAFKDDLMQPLRSAFRTEPGSKLHKAAKRVFKIAHKVGQHLDNFVMGPQLLAREHSQIQSKLLANGGLGTQSIVKGKSRKLLLEKHFGNKRAWDTVTRNGQIVKRKVSASMKKRRLEDSGSRDWETDEDFYDRDQDKERDARPLLRIKKSQWSESEAESSEEDDDVDEASFEEQEEEETEASGSDVASESEGVDEALEDDANEDTESDEGQHGLQEQGSSRDWWGARMTKAAMVPPVTRKYEVIEEYRIVEDKERVEQKMKVHMPDDYEDKFRAAKEKRGDQYAHLDIPDLKKFRPRKRLDEEVLEQEVYGIDPFTYNMLLNTMPADTPEFTEKHKQLFIEERLLRVLNKKVSEFTGSGRAPMEYPLEKVVAQILKDSHGNQALQSFCSGLLKNMQSRRLSDKYVAYRKGLGVVCNKQEGFHEGDFVVEFFGEVYPPWRWYEKQDGIRSLQKKDKDPAPEFYNIVFERPKGDALGYDVLVIDAMHKANFASRLCHSCRPNCEAKVTAVKGNYMIGVYTLRKIEFGEELTFDYCCITESKDEHDSSVCLCGSQGCKGSYLCYTGPGAYDEVLKEYHGLLDRHNLLLQACTSGRVTQRESEDLKQAGLGTCLLHGLPDWVIKYAAGVVAYLNFERQRLPDELMKAEMLKHTGIELDRQDVEVQADGVYNQRLQNLAITLDKVRYILTKLYGQASMAPAPLRMLKPLELVDSIWKGKKSIVAELLQCMAVHAPEGLQVLTRQIREHDPSQKGDIEGNLRKSLLWLRDTLRQVPATCVGRHDAAADLIHLYAYTKYFFTSHDYEVVESPPLLIHSCDLGPKHVGPPVYKWSKQYNKNYVWGQLISWFSQTSIDPGGSLVHNCRGCLMLPDISSCYAKTPQHDFRRGYSDKDRKKMIAQMHLSYLLLIEAFNSKHQQKALLLRVQENQPQKKWTPKYTPELWNFRSDRCLYGSPMMDAVVSKSKLNKDCMEWLKSRDTVFHGPWDDGP